MFNRPLVGFKCRICNATFATPEELRKHRMEKHKGYMLIIKR
jgi:stage III sporulation protein SpoIIIAA